MAQIESIDNEELIQIPSKTYKLSVNNLENYHIINNNLYLDSYNFNDRIIGFVDGLEAIKQSAYHILNVERYTYDIYDDNYGIELEQYLGEDFDYITATIKDTLEEALMQDDRITGVEIIDIIKQENDIVHIIFKILTILNTEIEMEVDVNV